MGRRLNTSTPTVIQTELVPLDENFAIEANGTLEQWYYDNTSQYAPDRSITPLILSPKIMVADKDSQQSWDDAHVTKYLVAWSVMESNTWVDITSASALSDYELSGNNLIVHKNVPYWQGVTIMCKLTYVDPRDNGIYITTQETVLLTCNRDANVVLPEVAITSPSARSFNPLVDGASTEYDFDAVVTNSPDVEMQSSDIATYEMDGSGTEEVISDANGIAPILDIRYPDAETQVNQEFAYRQTANGEKTDEEGAAFISKIKGNTVAWNQLIQNGDFSNGVTGWGETRGTASAADNICTFVVSEVATGNNGNRLEKRVPCVAGHKYYAQYFLKSTVSGRAFIYFQDRAITKYVDTIIGEWVKVNGLIEPNSNFVVNGYSNIYVCPDLTQRPIGTSVQVTDVILVDLTLIYGVGNEPTTPEQFEADYERWFGKPLSYEEYDEGSLRPVLMQSVKTTGFNQWDEETNTYDATHIVTTFIKVLGNTDYFLKYPTGKDRGLLWYYDSEKKIVKTDNPAIDNRVFHTTENTQFVRLLFPSLYGTTYNHDVCINISDPQKNGTYEPYEGHIASVPVTSAKGRLLDGNGNVVGNSVLVFPDGLKKAGDVQDEIFVEGGVVKAIKKVGSVNLGSLTWGYDEDRNIFYTGGISSYVKSKGKLICSKYTWVYYSSSQAFKNAPDKSISVCGFNTTTDMCVKDAIYTDAATFKSAMNGVMLYYELETPQTYVLDPVQNPFIYKWFGIDASNNEVLAETLPWYVSGQDTSKLKVDAMWGEKINVVLRAMMPTGALSPSKAYAALTWRIPDVDTTVVSYNGSAVRSNTNSMTFGTIVNKNGKNVEDSVKAAHLRFKWVYRKNFTNQETVAGWSQGESDQITIQASNLRSVRGQDSTLASTLVFPYVYCLGAWTTNQGTETGYSKPTTTKNGVTYYRIVD